MYQSRKYNSTENRRMGSSKQHLFVVPFFSKEFFSLQYLILHYIQKLPTTYNSEVTYNLTILTKLTILTLFTIMTFHRKTGLIEHFNLGQMVFQTPSNDVCKAFAKGLEKV